MELVKPLGNLVAYPVKSWSQIKLQALQLIDFIDNKEFVGNWREAYAIAHTQVSREPYAFFVIHKSLEKKFGHRCIINMKILKQEEPCTFKEGCMSFMHREVTTTKRWAKVTVKYQVPFLNMFLIPKKKVFKDIEAFICQHETDHAKGVNIYGL